MSGTNTGMALLVLGLVAGVLSGMFGIGGGLVIVPALIIVFGFGPKVATGTSLFALMWPVGLLGVVEYYKRNEMRTIRNYEEVIVIVLGSPIRGEIGDPLTVTSNAVNRGGAGLIACDTHLS